MGRQDGQREGQRSTRGAARWMLHILLWTVGVLYAIPLVWMAAVSLKPAQQAAAPGAGLLPRFARDGDVSQGADTLSRLSPAYWSRLAQQAEQNYRGVWASPVADFPLYLRNSMLVAVLSVSGMAVSSAIVAYGFSRVRWPGRDPVFMVVVATLMIPQAVLMAPLYVLFKHLGWIGTFKPLWAPAWCGGAFSIFLLRQFFLTIPKELDEAARMDGCSHWGTFWRVVLPLSKPVLAVVVLMQFIASWNDFVGPLLFLNHQDQYTLALGLHMYQGQHNAAPWNLIMAASFMIVAPVLVVYVLARRFFVAGVSAEGVKG